MFLYEKLKQGILFNGCTVNGHYSVILKYHNNFQYDSIVSQDICFTSNYRKYNDLDERLKNMRLGQGRKIFTEEGLYVCC